MNLSGLLQFGGLSTAKVLAGARGISAEVSSVSVLEVAESQISRWVIPNELYITSFYAIKDNIDMQKIVITALHSSGCCGLVLCHLRMVMPDVSPELIALCDGLDFPLIAADPEVSYVQILNPIFAILNRDTELSRRTVSLRQDFMDIITSESTPYTMMQKIVSKVGCELSLFDMDGNGIYTNKSDLEYDQETALFRQWRDEQRHWRGKEPWRCEMPGMPRLIFPVRSRQRILGMIVFNLSVTASSEVLAALAAEIAFPCAIALNRSEQTTLLAASEMQEFISDLLIWNFPSEEIAVSRGHSLGLDITNKNSLMVININGLQKLKRSAYRSLNGYIKQWFVPGITTLVHKYCPNSFVVFYSDILILFLDDTNFVLPQRELSRELVSLFDANERTSVSIGCSERFTPLSGIPEGYSRAFQAAILGRDIYGENTFSTYNDVYFFQQLRLLHRDPEARQAAEGLLDPLRAYDKKHNAELENSLHMLFLCRQDMQEAAERLCIHRNTLRYRRNKIEELLGYNPFELPHIVSIEMAFQSLKGR